MLAPGPRAPTMPNWLLVALVIPFAAVVLTSGIWVPLLMWLRRRRMEGRFQALAAELRATREGDHFLVPGFERGVAVRLHPASQSSPWVLEVAIPEPGVADPVRALGDQAILLRPERWLDRFGKRLGINREAQIGDEPFDRAVYIESRLPDAQLCALLGDAARRRAVLEILGAGFSRVRVHAQQSLVSASRARPGELHLEASTVREVAQRLVLLAPAIPAPEVPPDARARGAAWRLLLPLILAGIAATVALLGAGGVLVALRDAYPPLTGDLYRVALPVAAGVFAGAVVLAARVVRGRSDSLRTLLIVSGVLLYALPCYTVGAFLGINGALDGAPPARRRSRVVERSTTSHKGHTSYRLRLAPLRPGEDALVTDVDPPIYDRLAVGDAVIVITGEGALGWEWLQRVEPAPAGATPSPQERPARRR